MVPACVVAMPPCLSRPTRVLPLLSQMMTSHHLVKAAYPAIFSRASPASFLTSSIPFSQPTTTAWPYWAKSIPGLQVPTTP